MSTQGTPEIRELDREEIDAILQRNNVGRIAFSFRDRVDIEPIHYVHDDRWIYGRTTYGTKIETISRNYWVAFEVDEVEELFRWRSIVIRGGFYNLSDEATPQSEELQERAVEILRRLIPETFTENDPFPDRRLLFRVAIQEVRGLEAMPVER